MKKQLPKVDDRRVKTWFAFFPVDIDGERRWLEIVTVMQEWRTTSAFLIPDYWANIEFVDRKAKK